MTLQGWDVDYNLKEAPGLSLALFSPWAFLKITYDLWSINVSVLYVPLTLEVAKGLRKSFLCVALPYIYMLSAICGRPHFLYMWPWHLEVKNALHEILHEATPSVPSRESGEAKNPTSDFLLEKNWTKHVL